MLSGHIKDLYLSMARTPDIIFVKIILLYDMAI